MITLYAFSPGFGLPDRSHTLDARGGRSGGFYRQRRRAAGPRQRKRFRAQAAITI
jgi:hypothetical protein